MKLLFLSQAYKVEDQCGWNFSFERLVKEGVISEYINVPVRGFAKEHGWLAFYEYVVGLCKATTFDIVYFQFFHHGKHREVVSPRKCIENIRKILPDVVILTSSGDGFSDNWMMPDYPPELKEAYRYSDITFSTQMGKAADKLFNYGRSNLVFSPNGMCPLRFRAHQINFQKHHFDFDVVFVGSRNRGRFFNFISKYAYAAVKRERLVKTLFRHFGERFGVFGRGWNGIVPNQGYIPFSEQQKTFQRGRIVVGGNPYSYSDYYSSDRLFFEISSGIPTVELAVPRLNRVLRNQEHCYFCESIDEIVETCDRLLKVDPLVLYEKAGRAAQYIEERHTQYHRAKFELDTAIRYRENKRRLDVRFPYFLDEVDIEEEMKFAVRSKG